MLIKFSLLISFFLFSCAHNLETIDIDLFLKRLNILVIKKNIVEGNIVNINTTRTESGGVYIPVEAINCKNKKCEISPLKMNGIGGDSALARKSILKYEPQHPDADINGYVKYPNINIEEEENKLKTLNRAISFLFESEKIDKKLFFSKRGSKLIKEYPELKKEYDFYQLIYEN